ncbi:MAG: SemiSWEET family sugar transporter [Candidatus Micrarchaeia archaeon]
MLAVLIGDIGGILTTISIIPEIIVVYKSKRADQLSYLWLSIIWVGLALWVIYGLYISSVPLILFNILSLFLYSALIGLKATYNSGANSKR